MNVPTCTAAAMTCDDRDVLEHIYDLHDFFSPEQAQRALEHEDIQRLVNPAVLEALTQSKPLNCLAVCCLGRLLDHGVMPLVDPHKAMNVLVNMGAPLEDYGFGNTLADHPVMGWAKACGWTWNTQDQHGLVLLDRLLLRFLTNLSLSSDLFCLDPELVLTMAREHPSLFNEPVPSFMEQQLQPIYQGLSRMELLAVVVKGLGRHHQGFFVRHEQPSLLSLKERQRHSLSLVNILLDRADIEQAAGEGHICALPRKM